MLKVWKEKYQDKQQLIQDLQTKITQTKQELATTKSQEADKTAKINRLEDKLRLLEQTKTRLETELAREQQQHNQTKTNFQSQLRDLLTILFPNNTNLNNLGFSDLKKQAQKVKEQNNQLQTNLTNSQTENKELKLALSEEQKANQELQKEINKLKQLWQEQEIQIQELKLTKSAIRQSTQTDFPIQAKGSQDNSPPPTEAEKEWETLKIGIEKETDLTRLANGAYWDNQIQSLPDNLLPNNKKLIVLNNRRQQRENQLKREQEKSKQEPQIETKIENFPK